MSGPFCFYGHLDAMQAAVLNSILEKHIPSGAVTYCTQLWRDTPFQLILRKSRTTKLGDFSCKPGGIPRITLNEDSHPFQFLLTYLHEVAHLRVHQTSGFGVPPHGQQWKETFRELCEPVFDMNVFPADILEALRQHLINPPATCFAHANLSRLLSGNAGSNLLLIDIPEGSEFQLHGRWYKKGKLRRTRILCKELNSRRNYLISANAPVGS